MSSNVLEILRIADKEDVISNLLKYCIEQSASFRSVFLEQICGIEAAGYYDCQVYARLQVPKLGVPDLVVVCRGQTIDWAIIENKLKADEGKDQTERYANLKMVAALSKQLELGSAAGQPRFVFLTLFPDQIPQSEHFSPAYYSALLQGRSLLDRGEALALQLASDLVELLEDFYASEHLDMHDMLLEKLANKDALDAGYLAFRSLIRSLSLPRELRLDHFFRKSHQGRRYYGTVITKPGWKAARFDDRGERWILPGDNRYIQIEPQYDVLGQTLKVFIHYETNPYYTVKELEKHVDPDHYRAYITRRDAFARRLAEVDIAPFQLRVRPLQIASVTVSLGDNSVAEVQQEMQKLLTVATQAIDVALATESAG